MLGRRNVATRSIRVSTSKWAQPNYAPQPGKIKTLMTFTLTRTSRAALSQPLTVTGRSCTTSVAKTKDLPFVGTESGIMDNMETRTKDFRKFPAH